MEIIEISNKEYTSWFPVPYHIFNTASFHELNSDKCENVWYLLFKDTKPRLGLILGQRGDAAMSPFSAPFGAFSFLSNQLHQQHIDDALALLDNYLKGKLLRTITMVLPPTFEHFTEKTIN